MPSPIIRIIFRGLSGGLFADRFCPDETFIAKVNHAMTEIKIIFMDQMNKWEALNIA